MSRLGFTGVGWLEEVAYVQTNGDVPGHKRVSGLHPPNPVCKQRSWERLGFGKHEPIDHIRSVPDIVGDFPREGNIRWGSCFYFVAYFGSKYISG